MRERAAKHPACLPTRQRSDARALAASLLDAVRPRAPPRLGWQAASGVAARAQLIRHRELLSTRRDAKYSKGGSLDRPGDGELIHGRAGRSPPPGGRDTSPKRFRGRQRPSTGLIRPPHLPSSRRHSSTHAPNAHRNTPPTAGSDAGNERPIRSAAAGRVLAGAISPASCGLTP